MSNRKNELFLNKKSKTMKTTIKFTTVTLAAALILTACQEQSADKILSNETKRKEIMQTIANDQEMMMEMMKVVMESEHGMMMSGNKEMMNMMHKNPEMMQGMMQHMMRMAQSDSTMRNKMTGMMTHNEDMMQSMMQMMNEKGMISDSCMQASMNMMKEKGMDLVK